MMQASDEETALPFRESRTTLERPSVSQPYSVFGSEEFDDDDENFEDQELVVYLDENRRYFNKHKNHYAVVSSPVKNGNSDFTSESGSTIASGSTEVLISHTHSPTLSSNTSNISYSNRKRRVSVWIPTLTKSDLISSLSAQINQTVEFDFKKSSSSTSTDLPLINSGDKKYIGYSIDLVIGFSNDSMKCQHKVVRRYNEFKKFHTLLKKTYPIKESFSNIKFPSKSPITSYNDQNLLDYRKKAFNEYLATILQLQSEARKKNLDEIKKKNLDSFDFLIYYFFDIHNSPLAFLFDHPYADIFKQINQFHRTTKEEKRKIKRIIEIESNYDEEKENENGQFLLREQEWYEDKFKRIEELKKVLVEMRLSGDDFFVELKGKPHALSVDKASSSLLMYLLIENNSKDKSTGIDYTFVQQIYIDDIMQIRDTNNTYRGDGFEIIDITLYNSEPIQFYCFDRKELIYTIGAQMNQYKAAKFRVINYLVGTVSKLRKERYDENNEFHEKDLLELYALLRPDDPLIARKSRQWVNIGFQGDNPSTDFRGGGVMSLKMLLYFARNDLKLMKSLIDEQHAYPFCVSGINLFFALCTLLNAENLATCPIENIENKFPLFRFMCLQVKNYATEPEIVFGQLFMLICKLLHKIFVESGSGYMDYPQVVDKTKKVLEDAIQKRPNDFSALQTALFDSTNA